jgi:steroid delta-isomerase-like uncharacterized protein
MSPDENKAIIRRAVEAANAGKIEQSVAATAPDCLLNGQAFGRQGDRERTERMLAAFPDVRYDLLDLIAESDKVVARYGVRGTHRGELLGIAATGTAVEFTGITIYRLIDRQIVEIWENYDVLGLLRQLGAVPDADRSAG